MHKHIFAQLALFIVVFITAAANAHATSPLLHAQKDVALVYVVAGHETNDGPFIEMARKGAAKAARSFKDVKLKQYKLTSDDNVSEVLAKIASTGTRYVVAIGYQNVMPVLSIAERYPETRFTVIDGLVPPLFHNVQSVMFKDHEGAFLVGMLAAMKSQSDHIGFIGGVDIPLIRNFAHGYEQGAQHVSPKTKLSIGMIGNDSGSWGNEERARELAVQQYGNDVDVIFTAAGAAGLGVLDEASKHDGQFAIGVDSNQNGLYPGHVLTSMVKRVDKTVFEVLRVINEDNWAPGIKHLGLKEGVLDYSVDNDNRALITPEMVERVAAAREAIVNGTLDVKIYSPR